MSRPVSNDANRKRHSSQQYLPNSNQALSGSCAQTPNATELPTDHQGMIQNHPRYGDTQFTISGSITCTRWAERPTPVSWHSEAGSSCSAPQPARCRRHSPVRSPTRPGSAASAPHHLTFSSFSLTAAHRLLGSAVRARQCSADNFVNAPNSAACRHRASSARLRHQSDAPPASACQICCAAMRRINAVHACRPKCARTRDDIVGRPGSSVHGLWCAGSMRGPGSRRCAPKDSGSSWRESQWDTSSSRRDVSAPSRGSRASLTHPNRSNRVREARPGSGGSATTLGQSSAEGPRPHWWQRRAQGDKWDHASPLCR